MFDIAILLYVDRFCPENMSKSDTELLNRFVIYAFIWAYSMRAQYYNVGWLVAQNYIMETGNKVVNSYNIYKVINESDSPNMLLSRLSEITHPLSDDKVKAKVFRYLYLITLIICFGRNMQRISGEQEQRLKV